MRPSLLILHGIRRIGLAVGSVALCACAGGESGEDPQTTADVESDSNTPMEDSGGDLTEDASTPTLLRVVTFNCGSGAIPPADGAMNDGYGSRESEWSDEWYGNGLAYSDVVEDARQYFSALEADIVALQEVFWSGECPAVPPDSRDGFVCSDWSPGDPTVASQVLGPEWQIACHPGNPDKCIGVRRSVGSIRGCDGDVCLDGLSGDPVDGCGGGARAASAEIDLQAGGVLHVVNVHGNSGFSSDDTACRVAMVDRVFGNTEVAPLISADDPTLILGDLNTDPGRLGATDPSAARWNEAVEEHGFHFLTEVGPDAEPTYVLLNIDHVIGRGLSGSCVAGEDTTETVYFDHTPIVCELNYSPE